LPEVQATCDRVQIIHQGKLVLTDSIENLAQHMQTSSVMVRLGNKSSFDSILSIDGVNTVDDLENGYLRIHHDPKTSPAAAIAQIAVTQGWELLELTPEKRSLEEIFVDITTSETDTETEPAAA
jgi:ABC-2 type transport system ATP-binding protein